MAQRKHCVAITLRRPGRPGRSSAPEEIELGDEDVLAVELAPGSVPVSAPVSVGAACPRIEEDDPMEITSYEEVLDVVAPVAPSSPPPAIPWRGTPRLGLGKETMQALAPLLVRPLARPAAPPPRFPRSPGLLAAAAAVATVLLTASAALAWT